MARGGPAGPSARPWWCAPLPPTSSPTLAPVISSRKVSGTDPVVNSLLPALCQSFPFKSQTGAGWSLDIFQQRSQSRRQMIFLPFFFLPFSSLVCLHLSSFAAPKKQQKFKIQSHQLNNCPLIVSLPMVTLSQGAGGSEICPWRPFKANGECFRDKFHVGSRVFLPPFHRNFIGAR